MSFYEGQCDRFKEVIKAQRAYIRELEKFAAFARSCVLSGEDWTEDFEAEYRAAMGLEPVVGDSE